MKSYKKGFTLLEILVVITIIVSLAAIISPNLMEARSKARDTRRKADLEQIRAALEMYRSNIGYYPSTCSTGGSTTQCTSLFTWWGACTNPNFGPHADYVPLLESGNYIQKLPHDPKEGIANTTLKATCTAASACYLYKSNGTEYKLLAYCTVENWVKNTDQHYDPQSSRQDSVGTMSWTLQVSSSATTAQW